MTRGSRPDPDVVRGCSYCARPDCDRLFDHARLMAAREQTWREGPSRPFAGFPARDFSGRAAA